MTHLLVLRAHASSPIQSSMRFILSALISCSLAASSGAQQPLPNDDITAIHDRLNQQEVEIARLRNQLAEYAQTGELPAPAAIDPAQLPPAVEDQQLADVLGRLETLEAAANEPEKPTEKKAEKKEPEWVDMSADKWTVKLG